MSIDTEKRLAAEAAAQLVKDGMTIGLGTGSTVAFLAPCSGATVAAPALRSPSPAPRRRPAAGLTIEAFDHIDRFE